MKTLQKMVDRGGQLIVDAERGDLKAQWWCGIANLSATCVVAVIIVIVAWSWI